MDWKTTLLKEATRHGAKLKETTTQLGHVTGKALERARASETLRQGARVAVTAASALPVRELAVMCGRAGVAGAIVDGGLGTAHALKAMHKGKIDGKQAVKHIVGESGCGFVTSTAGTAGTLAAYMVTGAMGPVALIAGAGASMGSRYVYRRIVGDTLPDEKATQEPAKTQTEDDAKMEHIGPEV